MDAAVDEVTVRSPEPSRALRDTGAHLPVSLLLRELIDTAPADHFTLDWLIASLPERSFGILMLILAVLAMVPVGSMLPGLLLATLAVQMTIGRAGPVFPRRIALHPLPTPQLRRIGRYPISALSYVEKIIRPRWPAVFLRSARGIGAVVLLLTCMVLLTPLPLTNVPPAIAIALIALAYIEEDGALLAIGLLAALALLGVAVAAVWGAVVGAALLAQL
jgi:hypothetical protein